jgi:hypothetical protein
MAKTAKKIGNVWYSVDAEYTVSATSDGASITRGDGCIAHFSTIEVADEAAEWLAAGTVKDSTFIWVDPINGEQQQ